MNLNYSRIVDLGHKIYTNMPVLDDNITTTFWENNTFAGMSRYSSGMISARSKMMLVFEHVSTHVDAPSHFDPDGASVDKIPLDQLIVPGHLLDLTHKKPLEEIGPQDLEKATTKTGRPIEPNTIVIVNTGTHKDWGVGGFRTERPYLSGDGGKWLVDQGATLVGTDLIGIDDPNDPWNPTHKALLNSGVPMIQQLNNLDQLVGLEFLFVALPWQMLGGTACPVRPVALIAE